MGVWGVVDPIKIEDEWIFFATRYPTLVLEDGRVGDWKHATNIACTLDVLFAILNTSGARTNSKRNQLLAISDFDRREGQKMAGFQVYLSQVLCQFIRQLLKSPSKFDVIINAFNLATENAARILSKQQRLVTTITAKRPHRLDFEISGGTTTSGLHPEVGYRKENKSYVLMPHNMDTREQQLVLLAVIATIHRLAREAGY